MRNKKRLKVLFVGDELPRTGLIESELKKAGYDSKDVIHTISSKSDLEILRQEHFDLVLLDSPMLGIKVMDILKRVGEMKLDIPVTMIAGEESARAAIKAMEVSSYDYISKSDLLTTKQAAAMLGVTAQTIKNYIYTGRLKTYRTPGGHYRIRPEDIVKLGFLEEGPSKEELYRGYIATLDALANALDARDGIASGHSKRVAHLAASLTEVMGITGEVRESIRLAAVLHDVGKIFISERILSKPGKLTDQESYIMRQHPEMGEKIVNGVEFLLREKDLIRHHHERFDGKGYPDGLSGEEIPLGSRIICLAGAFDCITSDCTYQSKRDVEQAIDEIEKHSGTQFDPEIVRMFTGNRDKVHFGSYPRLIEAG